MRYRNIILPLAAAMIGAAGLGASSARAGICDFGPNVLVFDPASGNVQQRVDDIFRQQERNQFGSERYALLFKPGHYPLDLQMGFYEQAVGLGQTPDDVQITGAVRSTSGWMGGNATCNFWRAAENLSIIPAGDHREMQWSVSQGTELRRVHVKGELHLWDWGWSSGGFMADCLIDGRVVSGSQQQWLSRDSEWDHWDGGVWNMVFVGVSRPPDGAWPDRPYTTVDRTPVVREKPYLTIDTDGNYFVAVPALKHDSQDIDFNDQSADKIPIEQFYIAKPQDDAAKLNNALVSGKNLLLTPGIYHLDQPLHITRPGTIVLGLGYPTLTPTGATPAIVVDDIDGAKIGGLILDAGPQSSPALLRVGQTKSDRSHAPDPIFIYDLCARAGGATPGSTDSFVTINANNVVGDNLWLWRADHGAGAGWGSNAVKNGLIVNGNDVTMYGLFVEHCQEYQTLWNGDGGRVYFYQSEMPYDPPSQAAWSSAGRRGFASYKVADAVKSHEAWGIGIYSYFTDAPVVCDNAIEAPESPGIKFHDMTTIRLGGQLGSGIANVIDGRGGMKTEVEPVRLSR